MAAKCPSPRNISTVLQIKAIGLFKDIFRPSVIDSRRLIHPTSGMAKDGRIRLRMRGNKSRGFQGIVVGDVPVNLS